MSENLHSLNLISNIMITYKYSLKQDLRWSYRTLKNRKWLREQNLKIFYPNICRMVFLWIKKPKTNFQIEENIICYWVHASTWGAYTPPNEIFICPWQIEQTGGLERVIKHEISHLKYTEHTKKMSHQDKEQFINSSIL